MRDMFTGKAALDLQFSVPEVHPVWSVPDQPDVIPA